MTVEDQVLRAIINGDSPSDITKDLGLSRAQYYGHVDTLVGSGVLAKMGTLPEGAVTEVCPSPEATDFFSGAVSKSAWDRQILGRLTTLVSRYGWTVPNTNDPRYDHSKWTGQSYRRVDFTYDQTKYMVVGSIMPRMDNQPWHRATPHFRTVYVKSGPWVHNAWLATRGEPVTIDRVSDNILTVGSTDELTALTLAVAWVCEAMAVLMMEVG